MANIWLGNSPGKEDMMSTPAQIDGYEWRQLLKDSRTVKAEIRSLLRRALERYDANLLAQARLRLGDLDDLISRLEEIGRQTKE